MLLNRSLEEISLNQPHKGNAWSNPQLAQELQVNSTLHKANYYEVLRN